MADRDFNEQAMRRRIEQARLERERQEEEHRQAEQAERNRRKPHAQADGMTTIEKRIIARAEQHAQARARIEAGDFTSALRPKPTATARQRWDKAIISAVAECGGNRSRAVAMVQKRYPKLRAALVAEANQR